MAVAPQSALDPEDQLGAILAWLEAVNPVPANHQTIAKRGKVHATNLGQEAFAAAAIGGLCGVAPEEVSSARCTARLAALCEQHGGTPVDAAGLLCRAAAAGENQLEPVEDVVELWRHVLFAWARSAEGAMSSLALDREQQETLEAIVVELSPEGRRERAKAAKGGGRRVTISRESAVGRVSLGDTASILGVEETGELSLPPCPTVTPTALHEKIKELEQENQRLQQELRRSRRKSNAALDKEFEFEHDSWTLQTQLEKAWEQITALRKENTALRADAHQSKELDETVALLQDKERELSATNQKVEQLKQRLQEANMLNDRLTNDTGRMQNLKADNDELQEELRELRAKHEKVVDQQAMLANMHDKSRDDDQKLQCANERIKTMQEKIDLQMQENGILESKIHTFQMQEAKMKAAGLSDHQGGIVEPFTDELKSQMETLQRENDSLTRDLAAHGPQAFRALASEKEMLAGQCESYCRGMAELRAKLQEEEAHVAELRPQCAGLEAAQEASTAKVAAQDAELATCRQAAEELGARLQAAEARATRLAAEAAQWQARGQDAEATAALATAEQAASRDAHAGLQGGQALLQQQAQAEARWREEIFSREAKMEDDMANLRARLGSFEREIKLEGMRSEDVIRKWNDALKRAQEMESALRRCSPSDPALEGNGIVEDPPKSLIHMYQDENKSLRVDVRDLVAKLWYRTRDFEDRGRENRELQRKLQKMEVESAELRKAVQSGRRDAVPHGHTPRTGGDRSATALMSGVPVECAQDDPGASLSASHLVAASGPSILKKSAAKDGRPLDGTVLTPSNSATTGASHITRAPLRRLRSAAAEKENEECKQS